MTYLDKLALKLEIIDPIANQGQISDAGIAGSCVLKQKPASVFWSPCCSFSCDYTLAFQHLRAHDEIEGCQYCAPLSIKVCEEKLIFAGKRGTATAKSSRAVETSMTGKPG